MAPRSNTLLIWLLRIAVAFILLQTLFFKFTGAEESVYIFSSLNMEPWGRILTGILELIASLLVLVPATSVIGSALATGLMSGAVFFHLTKLGIEVKSDGGLLFLYCLIVLCSASVLIFLQKKQLLYYTRIISSKFK